MKVIRPVKITGSMIQSYSGVTDDTAIPSYNPASTYSAGVQRKIVDDVNDIHMVYESLQDNNLGHYPPDNLEGDTPWWAEVGPLNPWRLFSPSPTTMTSYTAYVQGPAQISYTLAPGELIDTLALINVRRCLRVEVSFETAEEGLLFSTEIDMLQTSGIIDWYTYLTRDVALKRDLVIPLPPAIGVLTVTLHGDVNDHAMAIGCLVVGKAVTLGGSRTGMSLGITDYSTKGVDAWNNTNLDEGPYSPKLEVDVRVKKQMVDFIHQFMALYRATPLVWVGSDLYNASIVYGYFVDFAELVARGQVSDCTLSIEGMI